MTRKDYVLIAAALREGIADAKLEIAALYSEAFANAADIAMERVACEIAVALGRDNARFDRERFLKACGL